MSGGARRALVIGVAALWAAVPSVASANTITLGQVAPSGTNALCTGCTAFQYSVDPSSPSYTVPAGGGVITGWRSRGDDTSMGTARLRILRHDSLPADRYEIVAESAEKTIDANTAPSFHADIPVQAGDVLGILTGDPNPVPDLYSGTGTDTVGRVIGSPGVFDDVGPGTSFSYSVNTPFRLNMSAVLYQSPPETTIRRHPPHRTTSHRATFTFTSDAPTPTFKCKLDDAARFSNCSSPKVYHGLDLGRHTFRVKAMDTFSQVDPTPASWSWRIH